MKRQILWISMCLPYDKVAHGGGKTFHYYINAFAAEPDNQITLIAKVLPDEEQYLGTINPRIRGLYVSTPKGKAKKLWAYAKSINAKFNPRYPYGNVLTKEIFDQIRKRLAQLKAQGYKPDVVILEWTWMMLFIGEVKRYFPQAVYVGSEHDVSFLGAERQWHSAEGWYKKRYARTYYNNLRRRELMCANACDLVVAHNEKDRALLLKSGLPAAKAGVIVPYFLQQVKVERCPNHRDIVFYGAMDRTENSEAAIWFIEQVLPKLAGLDLRFVVVGSKPPESLTRLQNERVVCTGFVDDVQPYLASAMCLAAPLLHGAGIKIKILEAMAMGMPVLTNAIGIEGIDAEPGQDFFFCKTAEEFAQTIRNIYNGSLDAEAVGRNAACMMRTHYDLPGSFARYSKKIYELIGENQ